MSGYTKFIAQILRNAKTKKKRKQLEKQACDVSLKAAKDIDKRFRKPKK